eukprot:scaffold42867_cov153-Skeletonema_marinoi.AAC.2
MIASSVSRLLPKNPLAIFDHCNRFEHLSKDCGITIGYILEFLQQLSCRWTTAIGGSTSEIFSKAE